MNEELKALINQTILEVNAGCRTLDAATELEAVLIEYSYKIVKITRRKQQPFIFDE